MIVNRLHVQHSHVRNTDKKHYPVNAVPHVKVCPITPLLISKMWILLLFLQLICKEWFAKLQLWLKSNYIRSCLILVKEEVICILSSTVTMLLTIHLIILSKLWRCDEIDIVKNMASSTPLGLFLCNFHILQTPEFNFQNHHTEFSCVYSSAEPRLIKSG